MMNWLKDLLARAPDPNWIEKQNQEGEITPDWWNISECQQVLYFAYGEDMPGKSRFEELIGPSAIQYGQAYTAEPLSLFHRCDNELKFAVALEDELRYTYPPAPLSSIRGELLGLEPHLIRKLDTYFDRGTSFIRKRIWLYISWANATNLRFGMMPTEGITRVASWIYVGKSDFWLSKINYYDFQPVARQDNLFMKNFYFYGDEP